MTSKATTDRGGLVRASAGVIATALVRGGYLAFFLVMVLLGVGAAAVALGPG